MDPLASRPLLKRFRDSVCGMGSDPLPTLTKDDGAAILALILDAESEVRRITGEVEAAKRWAKGWKMAARRRAERDRIARALAAALAARSSPEG